MTSATENRQAAPVMEAALQMSEPTASIASTIPAAGFQLVAAAEYLGLDHTMLRAEFAEGIIQGFPQDMDPDTYRFMQRDLDQISDHFDASVSAELGAWAHVCDSLDAADRQRLFELTADEA